MEDKKVINNKGRNISICVVFVAIIFGLSLATLLKKEVKFSNNENRQLQTKPTFSISSLIDGSYTSTYEKYVTDQFVMRDEWIAMKVYAERALQKKAINGVYFGKDGNLVAQHLASDIDKELVERNVTRVQQFVKENSEKYNVQVMIVPTIGSVNKELIPKFAGEYDQDKLIDQVKDSVGQEHFIDVRDTLNQHKEEYIYYKTDHHWTSLGAFYAYQEWAKHQNIAPYEASEFAIEKVSDSFLGTTFSKVNIPTRPDSISLYERKDDIKFSTVLDVYPGNGEVTAENRLDGLYNKKHLDEKDKYPVFLDGNHDIVDITSNVKNGKTLLVIKDSYAHTIVPVIAGHYERVIMIDYRYFNYSTKQLLEDAKVTDILVLYNTINFAEDKNSLKFTK